MKGLFSVPDIAKKFQYCMEPSAHDVWHGTQLRSETQEEKAVNIYLGLSCDSSNFRGKSWTPGTACIYNFDITDRNDSNLLMPIFGIQFYTVRISVDTIFMFFYIVLPQKNQKRGKMDHREKVESHKQFFDLVDFVLTKIGHLFRDGFDVYDSHLRKVVNRKLLLVRNIEDGQGLSRVCGCKGNGASIGACPYCQQKSYRIGHSARFLGKKKLFFRIDFDTVGIGAVTFLDDNDNERKAWAAEYKDSHLKFIASNDQPVKMTLCRALSSVAQCESDPRQEIRKNMPYDKRNVFHKHFPDYDYIAGIVNGPAHIVYNLVQDLMSLITSEKGQFEWTEKQRKTEKQLGRFERYIY